VTLPLDPAHDGVRGRASSRGPRSAAHAASDYLHELILTGVLRPGDRVHQDEVAKALGVSRQPVGVALIRMEADGLVDIRPRRGVYVGAFGEDTVRDSYQLIGVLQGYAVGRVAHHRDPAVVERLEALVAAMHAASSAYEVEGLMVAFYRTVNHAAGSKRLRSLMRGLDRFVPGSFFARFPEVVESSTPGAERVLDAIRSGDAERGERAVRDMWRRAGDIVVRDLHTRGVFPTPASEGRADWTRESP